MPERHARALSSIRPIYDIQQARLSLYHLTDVEPEDGPGDYREMTQGALLLAGHLVTVTILNTGDQDTLAEAIQIVESTRLPSPGDG